MWKPWELVTRSNEQAVANARAATTELARRRVERDAVERFLALKYADPASREGAERRA